MASIGIICPPLTSHINSMAILGQELQRRGHHPIFLGIVDIMAQVKALGLDFLPLGEQDQPKGSLAQYQSSIGQLRGLAAMRFAFETVQKMNHILCRDVPEVLERSGIEILLVDESEPIGGTIAEYLSIPFITINSGLPRNQEPGVPPNFTSWQYSPAWWAPWRNRAGYSLFALLTRSIATNITKQRRKWGLPPYKNADDVFSTLAQITQITSIFDWPRQMRPKCFHYVGPWCLSKPSHSNEIAFPYEKLTGQPIIYASLGTVLNQNPASFQTIAQACEGLDCQLILSLGRENCLDQHPVLPGHPLIVNYAPQVTLLSKATLAINHAGLNSTLEALSQAVPIVAIPNSADQPGVASRLKWIGAGEILPISQLQPKRLRSLVKRVLNNSSYKSNAARIQRSFQTSGGMISAVNIIEQVVNTRAPVGANDEFLRHEL